MAVKSNCSPCLLFLSSATDPAAPSEHVSLPEDSPAAQQVRLLTTQTHADSTQLRFSQRHVVSAQASEAAAEEQLQTSSGTQQQHQQPQQASSGGQLKKKISCVLCRAVYTLKAEIPLRVQMQPQDALSHRRAQRAVRSTCLFIFFFFFCIVASRLMPRFSLFIPVSALPPKKRRPPPSPL